MFHRSSQVLNYTLHHLANVLPTNSTFISSQVGLTSDGPWSPNAHGTDWSNLLRKVRVYTWADYLGAWLDDAIDDTSPRPRPHRLALHTEGNQSEMVAAMVESGWIWCNNGFNYEEGLWLLAAKVFCGSSSQVRMETTRSMWVMSEIKSSQESHGLLSFSPRFSEVSFEGRILAVNHCTPTIWGTMSKKQPLKAKSDPASSQSQESIFVLQISGQRIQNLNGLLPWLGLG